MPPSISRLERFDVVGSTNDVVRRWLADGTPEVCVAIADEQTAGHGRDGRAWLAPPGSALLLSLGFRPVWLAADRLWRLAAVVSLAMAEAGEAMTGVAGGTIGLKWPNDLVVDTPDGVHKLGGVLGETDGLGSDDPRAVIGIGVNGDWARDRFPDQLADGMTSLRELADHPIDHDRLLSTFLDRLGPRLEALRQGRFDGAGWSERQVTTGREVDVVDADGERTTVRGTGVDVDTGALLVDGRPVFVGEVAHVRLHASVATRARV